jgi:large subunit ribosomal protein L4
MVGGGVAFGPHPRSYRQAMPKKMKQQAIRCVLSDKASSGQLKIVDKFNLEQPHTNDLLDILIALGIDSGVLIATVENDTNLIKSAMNLAGVETISAKLLNVLDMLSNKTLLMSEEAVRQVESVWGRKESGSKTAASAE